MGERSSTAEPIWGQLLHVAIWFGIVVGLAEGVGLLLFQRINWAAWGHTMHVSEEILWISPMVDVLFFLIVASLVGLVARVVQRISPMRVLVFLLMFLAVYDWLTLIRRLDHRACLLLALGVAVAFNRWFGKRESRVLQLWKRGTPWAAAIFLLVLTGVRGGKWLVERNAVARLPAAASGSPNVLVIVIDALRADHLTSYGYSRATSPNVDRIARQGVLFENAIATCSWSLPSHVSLLTGRYEFEHGVGNVQPLRWFGADAANMGGYPTLGEALQQKGYRTGAFSGNRTYFSHDLEGRGFLHFEDYFHAPADMFLRTLYGTEFARIYLKRTDKSLVKRMLRNVRFTSLLDQDAEGSGSFGGAFGIRKHSDAVNRELLSWIDRDRQRPFFAFLNYFDVHDPYGGPSFYPKPAWKQETEIDQYDDGVKYVDDSFGQLMNELQRRGLAQNTLVVVTSDHGESLGQHGLETHGASLYWELVHVPLVMWYPGHVPPGTRVGQPVSNLSIAATIMDWLGDGRQDEFRGPSLSLFWTDADAAVRDWPDPLSELAANKYAISKEKAGPTLVPNATTGSMKSVVTPQWHLITHQIAGEQFYDWMKDPAELDDLVRTPEGRDTAQKLKLELERGTKARQH